MYIIPVEESDVLSESINHHTLLRKVMYFQKALIIIPCQNFPEFKCSSNNSRSSQLVFSLHRGDIIKNIHVQYNSIFITMFLYLSTIHDVFQKTTISGICMFLMTAEKDISKSLSSISGHCKNEHLQWVSTTFTPKNRTLCVHLIRPRAKVHRQSPKSVFLPYLKETWVSRLL